MNGSLIAGIASIIAVVMAVIVNIIIVAVKMGALTKTVKANREHCELTLRLHQEATTIQLNYIQTNQKTISDTVIELRKTNSRLTRELDKLIGQLTPVNKGNNHG